MNQADKEAFEKKFPMPSSCMRCGDGYAATHYNAWEAQSYIQKWEGFKGGLSHARSGEAVGVTTVAQIEAMKNGHSRTITARDPSFVQFPADNDVKLFTHNQPAEQPCTFPGRDNAKPAEQQGLFRKFEVNRVDGSDAPGGKHHGCAYFVIDMDHDAHAPAALRAYAQACKESHPQLSAELIERFAHPAEQPREVVRLTDDEIRNHAIEFTLHAFDNPIPFSCCHFAFEGWYLAGVRSEFLAYFRNAKSLY